MTWGLSERAVGGVGVLPCGRWGGEFAGFLDVDLGTGHAPNPELGFADNRWVKKFAAAWERIRKVRWVTVQAPKARARLTLVAPNQRTNDLNLLLRVQAPLNQLADRPRG